MQSSFNPHFSEYKLNIRIFSEKSSKKLETRIEAYAKRNEIFIERKLRTLFAKLLEKIMLSEITDVS